MSQYQSLGNHHCHPDHCSHLLHDSNHDRTPHSDIPTVPHSAEQPHNAAENECEQQDLGEVIPIGRETAVIDAEPGSGVNMLHEMFAGSVAACVARFVIAPLDVIKIRFQIQETPNQNVNQITHQISQPKPHYQSVAQAFRTIAREEGVRAFWKGNLAAELMVVPYGAVSFLAYQQCKHFMENFVVANIDQSASQRTQSTSANPSVTSHNHHIVNICSGSFAGFCATLATYPLDLMRTRFAAQQEPKLYTSLGSALMSVASNEGVRGLYAGMWPTLCGIVPLMAIQFGCYEGMKTAIERLRARQCIEEHERKLSQINHSNQHFDSPSDNSSIDAAPSTTHNSIKIWEQTICGFSAGVVSKFLTMPFDVVKKRFQVSGFAWDQTARSPQSVPSPSHSINPSTQQSSIHKANNLRFVAGRRHFTGVVDCFRGIVRHEGWRGLFKGTVPSTLKAGPNSAIIYVVYEQTMNVLQGFDNKRKATQVKKAQH